MLSEPRIDELVTFSQAAKMLPRRRSGRPCSPSTLWRWHKKGLGGVRLAAWPVGSTWCTTTSALQDFLKARLQRLEANA